VGRFFVAIQAVATQHGSFCRHGGIIVFFCNDSRQQLPKCFIQRDVVVTIIVVAVIKGDIGAGGRWRIRVDKNGTVILDGNDGGGR